MNGTPPTAEDDAPNRRPRDTRLIHTLLASQGVTSYQERVPLMLIDFAYRYTRAVLSEASSLDAEGYATATEPQRGRGGGNKEEHGVSMTSLRMAVAARQAAQVQPDLAKADMLEMGQELNRVGLPRVEREFGVRLPEERFVLTGGSYGLLEEWEEDEEIDDEELMNVDEQMADQPAEEDDGEMLVDEDVEQDEFEEVMGIAKPDEAMKDV